MTQRLARSGFVLLLLLSVGLSAGCGDDPVTVPPEPVALEIRNGTWSTMDVVSFTGPDTCSGRPGETTDSTLVLCNIVPGGDEVVGPFPVRCDLETNAQTGAVSFVCTVTADLDICRLVLEIVGSGTVTDTTYDLTSRLSQRIEFDEENRVLCELLYAGDVDPCTTVVQSTGAWVSADGDSICPADSAAAKGVPLESLLSGTAYQVVRTR